ncbi:xanthine dehydrogenase molybdopterin binding subunit [Aromatoleum petrolei]|uniref:Xanthine dehydrogenase molybdopterin binding subunit n=1 Tax=Aromatoleum petrolei TaxID=76116 RepID=A0ABX1N0G3_9RHOO|nr:xanthine dehydrogenase molybdopterin binding subunit [Aromatoleum petrolei]NMF90957.1 xanthine dehydrogenase molybdopterin binding subunit [Aromatoleum petrolei]QTQ35429.1 Xanthine dehydrogenase, molybdopterin binding subunit [Aromatoleum petrolei]
MKADVFPRVPHAVPAAHHAHPHESAHLHVSGAATYVDDIRELAGTAHAALGLSAKAHARIVSIDLDAVRAVPGVIGVLTAADIPGSNDCGPIIHDDPILADGVVHYIGQPVFAVIADSHDTARRAVRKARIEYDPLPAVLDPLEAKRQERFVVPPMRLVRGEPAARLAAAPRRLKGSWKVGGQEQFYLEGQISYAAPKEDGCIHLWCSTQHPTEMQLVVSHALALASNQVVVEMRRMGGAFGGKESQSALFASVAAVAAWKFGRPVKLRPDRDDDMMITGKRHDFHYDYEVGFDDEGRILAVCIEMTARAGFSADLSGPVGTRAICHFDNAYFLSDADIRALCARTNTQSNTAFRGFGGPQGAVAIEYIMDSIARAVGRDPLDVRKLNFYGGEGRNTTPYGQTVADNVIHELVGELEAESGYRARRAAIAAFNAASPVLKKGLALTPVKFGISFNVAHYNQAGALVHIYTDGSVLVNHGGAEMGQGLNTKVCQVVANELGISLGRVRATAADTSKVANTSATAASTGADLNGKAAEDAARRIRLRLAELAASSHGEGIDPATVRFADDHVFVGDHAIPFGELVQQAYVARVQLWSDGFYATPGLNWDRSKLTGRPFYYYAYGAAVSEVLVDTLTGEWRLLRADLLHDAGNSINPAIDAGQVEGGFIQGMGWLTMEELWWNKEGRLMTHAPSTYKIPATHDCPPEFRVRLFRNRNREDTILGSKAVGEPPLLLSFSALLAIRDAIAAVGDGRIDPPLRAPATPEAILDAVDAVRAQFSAAPAAARSDVAAEALA